MFISMTDILPEPSLQTVATTASQDQTSRLSRIQSVLPVLEKLFELYPRLFGTKFLPLKLGVFQELLERHPENFKRDTLKVALGVHTRSTRYLQSVADGGQRHDLDGVAVENVAPEHVHFALLELFRRRQPRSKEDLRPELRRQLVTAFEASGLTRQDYLSRVQTKDADANALLEKALEQHGEKLAKNEALLSAFENSGKTINEFAAIYGLDQNDVALVLAQKHKS